jgi:hypothetical protein
MMKRLLCIMALIMVFLFTINTAFAQTSFKVAWKEGKILCLLVPPNTTKEQLKDVVYSPAAETAGRNKE